MHGLWNGLAVLAGSRVIFQFESLTDRQQTRAVIGLMAPLAIATLTLLYLVARRAYRDSPKLDDATVPPTTLEPQPAFMR